MRSSPSTSSRFSVEASASGPKQNAGRRLAKTAMPLRSASSPASGRSVARRARPFRIADGAADRAHQHGVGGLGRRQGLVGEGHAVFVEAGAAEGALVDHEVVGDALGDAARFGGNLRADTVAGQQQQRLAHRL